MKRKSKYKAIIYGYLISLIFHVLLLLYPDRSAFNKHYERKIEVDLISLSSKAPLRTIPQPYRRPKLSPQTKSIKTPVKSLIPKPVFSNAPIKKFEPDKTFSSQAVEKIYSPLPAFLSSDSIGVIGQIKAVDIQEAPVAIKIASENFNQTLAYQGMIRQRIEEHKHFPPLAVKRGLEGRVGLRFLLYRDGHVEQVEVAKSSYLSLLDEAAVNAVKAGNPFPPFPASISQDSMVIEVALNFELRRGI